MLTVVRGGVTIFDKITSDDLIVAFYPCIYFCAMSQVAFSITSRNYRKLNNADRIKKILERSEKRTEYYDRLVKFCGVCLERGIRMVFENPYSEQTFLKSNFLKSPDIVDMNRMIRGDFFKKPTAYWFWNCEPTHGLTIQNDKQQKTICTGSIAKGTRARSSSKAGLCSEERSMISSDYARNWICDFILGKTQNGSQLQLELI